MRTKGQNKNDEVDKMDLKEVTKKIKESEDLKLELSKIVGNNLPVSRSPWIVGEKYFIRTVTMALTGECVWVGEQELVLKDASWIADTGRFSTALKSGEFSEVEPFPHEKVIIGRGSVIDATVWDKPLPRSQK